MAEFQDVRIIGFDLDQTLYPKSPEIDAAIQDHIYDKIVEHKACTREEARSLFLAYYPELSGSKTLEKLGLPNPREIIQQALENADIDEYLTPDPEIISLLNDLRQRYGMICLITGSNTPIALNKLRKLGIPRETFDIFIGGEIPKSDGTAYREWLRFCKEKDPAVNPANLLYIGDRKSTDVDIPAGLGMRAVLVNVEQEDPSIDVPQFRRLADIRKILL